MRLGPFLEQLRGRLAALSREELVQCLVAHGPVLEPEERAGFLAIFTDDDAGRFAGSDPTLLDDVDDLEEELREGSFVDGWGWDEAIREERAWGDESWAWRMDDLFSRAAGAFVAGELELAAEAYHRLFEIFELEERAGPVFPGAEVATDLVDTDLPEAYARFLRARYEIEEPARRPSVLVAEVRRSGWLAGRDAELLTGMDDAREAPLPDLAAFLPAWIDALHRSREEGDEQWGHHGWERLRRRLLREAVERHGGVEGLAVLARRSGDPEAFLEWSRRAAGEGDLRSALRALGEGLDGVSEPGQRAAVADRLAGLARATDQWELAFCARRLAWRLEPTGRRLRSLAYLALDPPRAKWELRRLMTEELRELRQGDLAASSACAGLVEVFAGDLEAAARRLEAEPAVGWSSWEHPGTALLPVLLVAAAGRDEAPGGTILHELWQRLDGLGVPRWSAGLGDLHDAEAEWIEQAVGVAPPPPTALSDLVIVSLLDRGPLEEGRRRPLLEVCRQVVLARTRNIVANQHRGAYDRAAAASVACAEALVLAGWPDEGRGLLAQLREEFPRHSSFKRSLEDHEGRSSLLG